MTEREIYDGVIVNGTTDFIFVAETLRRCGAGWCVIDDMAANSYATPAYTADLDLVVISTTWNRCWQICEQPIFA